MMHSRWRRVVPWLLAGTLYVALTLMFTWPLPTRLSDALPHDLGDPLLNTWILWWNAHVVPLTTRWWDAPIFWPSHGALALSEHLLGLSILTTPIQWLGGSPVTTYNLAFLLSFPSSALAAHALAYTIAGRHDAATIAGVTFGFNPYRISQVAHLQMMWPFWMAIALMALHRDARDGHARWLVVFAVSWLCQALSNNYYLLFFPVLLALWLAWFFGVRAQAARLVRVAAVWIIASLPLLPILLGYRHIHEQLGVQRGLPEIRLYSADVAALALTSPLSAAWSRLSAVHRAEQQLFPGVTAALLVVAAAVVCALRVRPPRSAHRSIRVALAIAACGLATAALSAAIAGPWRIAAGGRSLVSVGTPSKPLTLAIWCAVAVVASGPRFRAAARRQSAFLFYVCATLLMFVLSFGPEPTLLGAPILYKPPYAWLLQLPGYDAVRVPARFAMLAELCLGVAAALGFARLARGLSPRLAAILAGVAIAGVTIDGSMRGLPIEPLPERLMSLESRADTMPILELPPVNVLSETAAMYRSIYHRRPLINGYSGYFPAHYAILRLGLNDLDQGTIDTVAASGPVTLVVDEREDRGQLWTAALAKRPGVVALGAERGRRIFNVPAVAARDQVAGEPFPITSVLASVTPNDAGQMTDGDFQTRWTTGMLQRGDEVVTIDLGSVRGVEGVTLFLGPFLGDYPRRLAIDGSEDGTTWRSGWMGPTAGAAVAGATRDPHRVPVSLPVQFDRARFVRLRQLASDREFPWSIAELRVLGRK